MSQNLPAVILRGHSQKKLTTVSAKGGDLRLWAVTLSNLMLYDNGTKNVTLRRGGFER